jgi:hypothetical protein
MTWHWRGMWDVSIRQPITKVEEQKMDWVDCTQHCMLWCESSDLVERDRLKDSTRHGSGSCAERDCRHLSRHAPDSERWQTESACSNRPASKQQAWLVRWSHEQSHGRVHAGIKWAVACCSGRKIDDIKQYSWYSVTPLPPASKGEWKTQSNEQGLLHIKLLPLLRFFCSIVQLICIYINLIYLQHESLWTVISYQYIILVDNPARCCAISKCLVSIYLCEFTC